MQRLCLLEKGPKVGLVWGVCCMGAGERKDGKCDRRADSAGHGPEHGGPTMPRRGALFQLKGKAI